MKTEPELVDHPKYLLLRKRVGDLALEFLLRLWGHCEANKRGELWRAATADYVEAVCRWKKTPGKLYAALKELNWLHEESEGVRIHDWEKTNWRAVTNWELGSRPKTPAQAKPKPRLPAGSSPLNEGMTELNEGGDEFAPRPITFESVWGYFQKNDSGYTREQVREQWLYYDALRDPQTGDWRKPRGNTGGFASITDWRSEMASALLRFGDKKNAAPKKNRERWQVEKDLEMVREQIRLHPKINWPGNKPMPDAIKAAFEALLQQRADLERELKETP